MIAPARSACEHGGGSRTRDRLRCRQSPIRSDLRANGAANGNRTRVPRSTTWCPGCWTMAAFQFNDLLPGGFESPPDRAGTGVVPVNDGRGKKAAGRQGRRSGFSQSRENPLPARARIRGLPDLRRIGQNAVRSCSSQNVIEILGGRSRRRSALRHARRQPANPCLPRGQRLRRVTWGRRPDAALPHESGLMPLPHEMELVGVEPTIFPVRTGRCAIEPQPQGPARTPADDVSPR